MNPKNLKLNHYYLCFDSVEEKYVVSKYIKNLLNGYYKYTFKYINRVGSHIMTDYGVENYVIRELTYEETMAEIL